jgi:hypothetical protein
MNMEIVKLKKEHAFDIIKRNKEDGLVVTDSKADLEKIGEVWENGGPAYTLMIDGQIVCCAGVVLMEWNRGEAWTLVSSLFYKYPKTSFKAIKVKLDEIAREKNLRRVQSVISSNSEWGERWMEHLGFQKEGTLRAYGPSGGDFVMFSRIYNNNGGI